MNIEYINKITQIYFLLYLCFIIFICLLFLFTLELDDVHNQTSAKYFRLKSCESCFFYSLHCDDVCVAWWKRGKVWWCNTLWGWMLHTLFLSLLPLKRSVCLLFHLVLLWCLHFILVSMDKVETEHYRFLTKCFFFMVGYAMTAWLESLLYEVKPHSKIKFKPFLFPA